MKRLNTARILPVLALAVAAAMMAPAAFARDHGRGDRDNHGEYRNDNRSDYRDDRSGYRERDRDDDRDYRDHRRHGRDRVVYVAPRYNAPRYNPPPRVVYRPAPQRYASYPRWSRGARYNDRGYAPTYVVSDYYGYGLHQPPRGYHWRRDDRGDFLLVAIATGIIAEVLFH